LASLSTFNIDILKIDGSLIKNINIDETSTVITRHIIRMAQELKIKLVAERVETWDQLTFLRELKCYSGQGHIYSKPVPLEKFEEILAKKELAPVISDGVTVHGGAAQIFQDQVSPTPGGKPDHTGNQGQKGERGQYESADKEYRPRRPVFHIQYQAARR
jgi:hypothetical protein